MFCTTYGELLGLKDPIEIRLNNKARAEGRTKEFDMVVIYDETVLVNEVKATASLRSIEAFVNFSKSEDFFKFFPYLKGKWLISFVSAMEFTDEAVQELTANKIFALTPCPDMQILNLDQIS